MNVSAHSTVRLLAWWYRRSNVKWLKCRFKTLSLEKNIPIPDLLRTEIVQFFENVKDHDPSIQKNVRNAVWTLRKVEAVDLRSGLLRFEIFLFFVFFKVKKCSKRIWSVGFIYLWQVYAPLAKFTLWCQPETGAVGILFLRFYKKFHLNVKASYF